MMYAFKWVIHCGYYSPSCMRICASWNRIQLSRSKMNVPPGPVCRPMRVSSSRYVNKYSEPTFLASLSAPFCSAVGNCLRKGMLKWNCDT